MAKLTKLKVAIKTGSERYAGTDAAVYLVFCSPDAGRIYRLPTKREELEAGKLDIYQVALVDGPELSSVQSLLIASGMNGQSPAWRILWIKIDGEDADGRSWRLVDTFLERWLDNKEATAPVACIPLSRPFAQLAGQQAVPDPTDTLSRIP